MNIRRKQFERFMQDYNDKLKAYRETNKDHVACEKLGSFDNCRVVIDNSASGT